MNSLPQPDPLPTTAQQRILIQNQAFQAAINGEPLVNTLNILAQLVKLELGSAVRTAFYLAYPDGKRLHAIEGAGDMDPAYTAPLNGFPVSDDSFCSGYAMAIGRPVHTPDVLQDPHWQAYRHLATAHGFRAASSYPILTRQGKAIGSLALYFPHVHQATAQEAALAKAITQAAGIILSPDTQTREHTRAEEALRTSNAYLNAILDVLPAGLAIADASGKVLRFNEALNRIWGIPPIPNSTADYADWKGRFVDSGLPLTADDWAMARTLVTGQPVAGDVVEIERFDGGRATIINAAAPIKDEQGRIVGGVVAELDITKQRAAEEALRQADRRKDEFLAMLAHELRNPMATLHNTLLLLELTQGQDQTLPLDRALAMMNREVTHLNRMVDDLLDVSRISQGKIQLKRQRLDLTRLLREALEAARSQLASQGHKLTSQLPDQPVWVAGDQTRLTQVIRNLVTNAAKYTPPGGQITVALGRQDRMAVLRIRDTGIGIAADQLEAIFEVFVQVSSSLDRPQGGLGLGLAVVKQLVELHEGHVGVQSSGLGQGSEFTVRLPLLSDVPVSSASAGVGQGPAQKAWRILVVDDNADLALTTALLLRVKKYEAHTCLSGPEALKLVASLQPDGVLLDLGMPGMDGYETCRRLRELDWGQQGVIVALSGYGQEEDKKRTQEAGFDGHLVKPVNLQTLTALLDRLLNDTKSGQ